jgi:hypothetical protein
MPRKSAPTSFFPQLRRVFTARTGVTFAATGDSLETRWSNRYSAPSSLLRETLTGPVRDRHAVSDRVGECDHNLRVVSPVAYAATDLPLRVGSDS